MKAVLNSTDEFWGRRFERLCNDLNVDTPGDRFQIFGHLNHWFSFWAKSTELDSGLWFGNSISEIGGWAGVSKENAPIWGRALHKNGYVATLKEAYPEPLGTLRPGWVALRADEGIMLDHALNHFKKRRDATTLALYVSDRDKRIAFANSLQLDAEALERAGTIPVGWLKPVPGQQSRFQAQESSPNTPHPQQVVGGYRTQIDLCGGQKLHTANPKSSAMLETVRKYKYDDPERALLAMDNSIKAARNWHTAVAKDRAAVSQLLSELVETDNTWEKFRNPASVVTAKLKALGLVN